MNGQMIAPAHVTLPLHGAYQAMLSNRKRDSQCDRAIVWSLVDHRLTVQGAQKFYLKVRTLVLHQRVSRRAQNQDRPLLNPANHRLSVSCGYEGVRGGTQPKRPR